MHFFRTTVLSLSLCALLFIPAYTQAQTREDLLSQLAQLRAQLAELIAQTTASPLVGSFSRNLQLGDRGDDVRLLQQVLNQNPATQVATEGFGAPNAETTYFGQRTYQAVLRFQTLHASAILAPLNLSTPTGFVGPATRAILSGLVGGGSQTQLDTEGEEETDDQTSADDGTLRAPTNFRTSRDSDDIRLSWDAVSGATSYSISRSDEEDGDFDEIGTATQPNYWDRDLEERTTYYYTVTARNAAGQRATSEVVEAKTTGKSSGGGSRVPEITAEEVVIANSGVFLEVSPETVYQERSVTPSTPAEVGDPVGTIVGTDGTYFAVATADGERGTLRRDGAGNYYLDATGSAYKVQNAAGTLMALGNEYTHVGGWILGVTKSTTFSTANNNNSRVALSALQNYGNRTNMFASDGAVARLFNSTDDPASVPHVIRIEKGADTALGFYGDNETPGNDPVAVFNTSAYVQGLALFTHRHNLIAPDFDGRFYGGVWVPGALTEEETKTVVNGVTELTVPGEPIGYTVDTNPVILDFTAGEFEWGGQSRQLSDLADNGDGTYTLDFTDWWSQAHTIVVDYEIEDGETPSGVALTINNETTFDELVLPLSSVSPRTQLHYRSSGQWTFPDYHQLYVDSLTAGVELPHRQRAVWIIDPGTVPERWVNLDPHTTNPADPETVPLLPPTSVVIGRDGAGSNLLTNATVHRVALYAGAKTDDEIPSLMAGAANPVHFLGDSFVVQGNFPWRMENRTSDEGFISYTRSGVGGVAFYEAGGKGHAQRYVSTPWLWGATLVLIDGGFEHDRSDSEITSAINSIIENNTSGRILFVEPNPLNPIGDSRRDEWEAKVPLIEDLLSPRVPTLEAFFAANDGSSNDASDIANGLWPRSLTGDGTHPGDEGKEIYTTAVYGELVDRGWLPGSTSVPTAVENLAAAGSELSWDAPDDDGGHPVQGYLVEEETSPGVWEALSPQGSPTGYDKQYLRAYTVAGAGAYRVSAINAVGTGPATSVVVN